MILILVWSVLQGVVVPPVLGATFNMRLLAEPTTLDWNKAYTPIENYMLYNLMEGLVTFDSKFKPAPSLASSWKISPDGKTYTFKLRKDVKWSDGVLLKAKDFIFSWKRLLTSETGASYAYLLFDVVNAEKFYKKELTDFSAVGIKALDDFTLEVTLQNPIANWIYIPTFWVLFPLREDVVLAHGSQWARPGKMVSLGPYTLFKHDPESRIILKSNPHYFGKRGNVDEVIGQMVRDDATALTLFESGKLDFVTDLSMLDIKRLLPEPELKKFTYLKTVYMGFNSTHPLLSQKNIRKALAMAINRELLTKVVVTSQEPARSFVPRGMMGFFDDVGVRFNPKEAKKLLGDQKLPPLTLLTSNLDRALALSQFIQAELKKNLGLTVEIESYDYKTFRSQLHLKKAPLFVLSWSADYPDPDNYLSILMSNSGNNRTGWSNVSFDQEVLKARFSRSPKERLALYRKLQKLVQEEEAALLPLYYEPNLVLVSKRTKNFNLNPINYLLLREVSLAE